VATGGYESARSRTSSVRGEVQEPIHEINISTTPLTGNRPQEDEGSRAGMAEYGDARDVKVGGSSGKQAAFCDPFVCLLDAAPFPSVRSTAPPAAVPPPSTVGTQENLTDQHIIQQQNPASNHIKQNISSVVRDGKHDRDSKLNGSEDCQSTSVPQREIANMRYHFVHWMTSRLLNWYSSQDRKEHDYAAEYRKIHHSHRAVSGSCLSFHVV
jgi:hypothetical protein